MLAISKVGEVKSVINVFKEVTPSAHSPFASGNSILLDRFPLFCR
jgi:hypothetical protein